MRKVLILRPEPGAGETAARARALGLAPVVAPLFAVRPLDWTSPDPAGFDAVAITSANAPLHAGPGLQAWRALPCYAVGESSAAAARAAGFADLRVGPGGGAALAAMMRDDGVVRAFHPCGREHMPLGGEGLDLVDVPVYAAEAREALPEAAAVALAGNPLVLLHSPRAAATFAALAPAPARTDLAAISAAAAEAAGSGWRSVVVAGRPRDAALLALAAKLCQNEASGDDRACG